ncbi:MAG: phosphate/phosphite/phosphonate ABC transporter substrate-binding protein [Rubritepida sp.]|nr:phosphate/phosphite/phosphonate ABC transporter substrate-binding protein [Rubritepida sp.]
MFRRLLLAAACGFSLSTPGLAQTAAGADCPRGALDARFCDRDGDMVADTPTDPRQQVDPPVLIFAYTPLEDPSVYRRVFEGFLQHLSRVTGKRTQFFSVQSNAAQIEAMRAGRLHIAGFNTGGTPLAVNCAGFVPFAVMASRGGEFGYEMEIIVRADSPIRTMEDLRGRNLAFTSQTSNSGFRVPSALLRDQFNMIPERDFRAAFSGSHQNSIVGVANRDYEAAAIANEVLFRMAARNVVNRDQFRTIYKSATFPTTGYGMAHNLTPALQERIREAFFSFNWEGSDLQREFSTSIPPMERFLPITYRQHWEVVRQSDAAVGVQYRCQ